MDPIGEAAVVFQTRWLPAFPETDDLSAGFDVGGTELQGWRTESDLSGTREPDDLNTKQGGSQFEISQRFAYDSMYPSLNPDMFLSLLGPLDRELATHLRKKNEIAEPWNTVAIRKISHAHAPPLSTYSESSYPGSKLGTAITYHTAYSEFWQSAVSSSGRRLKATMGTLSEKTEYLDMLRSTGLWPVDPQIEQNWSGRGQHVEFKKDEEGKVNELLAFQRSLGSGVSGMVDKVKCGRIFLARKTISTARRFTKNQAIEEVAHMTRLKHSHIIRLIGTYTWKTHLCILMYPVANYDLESFLYALKDPSLSSTKRIAMASSCLGFFSCLSSALRHIHSDLTKHMDIKPLNILVRTRWRYRGSGRSEYHSKVYLSDFGIARTYQNVDAINTDGATAFTRKYAAPEVAQGTQRDLSVDVFSLGCVFLEMFAALDEFKATQPSNTFQETRIHAHHSSTMQDGLDYCLASNQNSDRSYQGNLNSIQKLLEARIPSYIGASVLNSSTLTTILKMIRYLPIQRPTANDLIEAFGEKSCCKTGPDELEVADDDSEHNFEQYPNRQIESNQVQSDSAEFWTVSALSGLTSDHHLSGTVSGELEWDMTYQPILISHMQGWW